MRFVEFYNQLQKYSVFSRNMIEIMFPWFDKRRLSERKMSWKIVNITRWWWCFPDRPRTQEFLFFVAQRIYSPSYISLHSALKYYNLIPETVITITSISTKKTQTLSSDLWMFKYSAIQPFLFVWYSLLPTNYWQIAMATPEKAITDFLYYNTWYNNIEAFDEWRINVDELRTLITPDHLKKYLTLYPRTTQQRVRNFISYCR